MKNPCGTTRANILERKELNGIPVYFGTGVNPVNSPAQFFVAWGEGVLEGGLVHTYNSEQSGKGIRWFIDEDDAEHQYTTIDKFLCGGKNDKK